MVRRCYVVTVRIDGDVAAGWSAVADAFRQNFAVANELGAALTVYADGEPVVDLWGGIANERSGAVWERDTTAVVFSSTKGVSAICVHMLVERGLLDLDTPVSKYWPEFGQAGKQSIPVRWVLTHQCGLPCLDENLTLDDLLAGQPVLRALEAQTPRWEPGTAVAYHAVTFGHLVGELVHRVTGRSLGTFFDEEIARPLGLKSWLGFPRDATVPLARMERAPQPPPPAAVAHLVTPESQWVRAITLGAALPYELVNDEAGDFNDRRVLAVELGGSNLVTDARSLARLYAATVGDVDGTRLLAPETVRTASEIQTRDLPYHGWPEELATVRFMDFALGFVALGDTLSDTTFGHGGAGGSCGFGDLDHRIGFAYVMNRMDAVAPDIRAASLAKAVRAIL